MGGEIRVIFAVLRNRTVALAVGQDRLETVKLAAVDVRPFIQDQTGGVLFLALPQDPRLVVVRPKTFL